MKTTYSQNFEDVLLFRVLGHLEGGFYVDVGANHPDYHSVTRLFYEMGWSGINIEPSRIYFEKLQCKRLRDININSAVGSSPGEMEFYEVAGTGLSSLDGNVTKRASKFGFAHRTYTVPIVTLDAIFAEYCPEKTVGFLKIDVEGWEKQALEGLDLRKWRPIIILVEAIHPDTQKPVWDEWEKMIIDAGYSFVWFDGINRFYLRDENMGLKCHFNSPPNVLDQFCITSDHPLNYSLKRKSLDSIKAILKRYLPQWVYELLRRVKRVLND